MTLTDAGPLVALIDADEAEHEVCRAALSQLELPLLTTWPAFTEAMYLYADLPMDLADATMVAIAEERGVRRVFALDSDFQVYRLHGRQRFDVVPGPR